MTAIKQTIEEISATTRAYLDLHEKVPSHTNSSRRDQILPERFAVFSLFSSRLTGYPRKTPGYVGAQMGDQVFPFARKLYFVSSGTICLCARFPGCCLVPGCLHAYLQT